MITRKIKRKRASQTCFLFSHKMFLLSFSFSFFIFLKGEEEKRESIDYGGGISNGKQLVTEKGISCCMLTAEIKRCS